MPFFRYLSLVTALFLSATLFAGPTKLPWYVPQEMIPLMTNPANFQMPNQLRSSDLEVAQLIDYALQAGKRLRPWLCYSSAGLNEEKPESVQPLACLVEWVHAASLIHDDIIDGDEQRRGQPTIINLLETKVGHRGRVQTILLGDWLLAAMVEYGLEIPKSDAYSETEFALVRNTIVKKLVQAIRAMTEGEILQARLLSNNHYSREGWEEVARKKTGLLFEWSLEAPSLYFGQPQSVASNWGAFGLRIAKLFQARDDIKDANQVELNLVRLVAAENEGKKPGDVLTNAAIDDARSVVQGEIQVEVTSLKEELAKYSQEKTGLASSCAQSIAGFLDLLAM